MSSVPAHPSHTPQPMAAPRPMAPAPAQAAAGSIDPVKLLNKYKWLLVAASVAGAVLGVAAHFVLLRVNPVWRPQAVFRILPPPVGIGANEAINTVNPEEMSRFTQTQVKIMMQDSVLRSLAQSPELQDQARKWCEPFYENGVFNDTKAFEELQESARARVIPQTWLIEMSVGHRNREDATTVLRLLTNTYLRVVTEDASGTSNRKIQSLRDSIKRTEEQSAAVRREREDLIRTNNITGNLQDRSGTIRAQLEGVDTEMLVKSQKKTDLESELKAMKDRLSRSSSKERYTDEMLAEAERDPEVINANNRVRELEESRDTLRNRGFADAHREVKAVENRLIAALGVRDAARAKVLDKLGQAQLERLAQTIDGLKAQIDELANQQAQLNQRLTDIGRIASRLDDLDAQIKAFIDTNAKNNAELQTLIALLGLETSRRVVLLQQASLPNEISFPKLSVMGPAGVFLVVLLVGGIALVRELIDQRVKSPADIMLIPRARLLGWIPDAAEDPEGVGATETAFRDRGRGVLAESFRQIRASMAKRLQQAGHKTVVVIPGLPGSGATSIVSNLALACAAADMRVLVIDANFRRPNMHRVFGLVESPGLADVLAKAQRLDAAVQKTTTSNLDVLTAGAKDLRLLERLSTDAMSDVLAQARSIYDIVLFDTAPAVVGGEGVALANRCDASILVVRAMSEKRGLVARVKNELMDTRAEFLGVVVNAVRAATGGYLKHNIRTATEYQRPETPKAA